MTPSATGTRRLALATADAISLAALRGPLIVEAVRRRHKVMVLTPDASADVIAQFEQLGATVASTAFAPRGLNPFGPMLVRRDLAAQLRTLAPHTVAYCDGAALLAVGGSALKVGVPRTVAMISGTSATSLDMALYQTALARVSAVMVETSEDRRRLTAAPWLDVNGHRPDIVTTPAAGIDLIAHPAEPLPPLTEGLAFVLVSNPADTQARALFRDAASRLAARVGAARFVDPADQTNDATSFERLIRAGHVAVHTAAGEGLSRGLLQALAAGRPVIATDVGGSRDTVDERVNGCLVPPADAAALADAITAILRRPDLLPSMARASRLKAERRFDLAVVNSVTLDALGLAANFAAAA